MKIARCLAYCDSEPALRHEIKYLLAELTGHSLPELALCAAEELDPATESVFQSGLERLKHHEPVQYILGKAWFWGMELDVNPSVLIPRPETEMLVELALKELSGDETVIDIGTGSGAIAIALKKALPGLKVYATDIDPQALETARSNAAKHCVGIEFRCSDLFPDDDMRYDLVISNPPYISAEEYATLESKVRLFEPEKALLAADEGLDFYIRILKASKPHLSPNAKILFEHGYAQRKAIKGIAILEGFRVAGAYKDLNEHDRCLSLIWDGGGIDG
ncbi:MAG: peptide chain release factor N(5)-glutamine methyltransferase [Candidatus Cloacimonadaceae bacterium]|nr:peptide chain release factor N(5)-glutamine methyltransferase [Candidatus Cloacimonadaceae bacterium]